MCENELYEDVLYFYGHQHIMNEGLTLDSHRSPNESFICEVGVGVAVRGVETMERMDT